MALPGDICLMQFVRWKSIHSFFPDIKQFLYLYFTTTVVEKAIITGGPPQH